MRLHTAKFANAICKPILHNTEVITTFLSEMNRAKDFCISTAVINDLYASDSRIYSLIPRKMKEMPLLEHLELHLEREYLPHITSFVRGMWRSAPKLRTLFIANDDSIFLDALDIQNIKEGKFPFSNLTRIEFHHISHRLLIAFLSWAENIVDCEIGHCEIDINEEFEDLILSPVQLPLKLPHLKRLTQWRGLIGWVTEVETPALTFIKLSRFCDWLLPIFTALIQNSPCNIEHLVMDVELWDEGETVKCLRLLPFLQMLVIEAYCPASKYHDGRDLLDDLFTSAMRELDAPSEYNFLICPSLEYIKVDYGAQADPSLTPFTAMVEERWMKARNRRPFKVGIMDITKEEKEGQCKLAGLAGLLVLKQDGLDLKVD